MSETKTENEMKSQETEPDSVTRRSEKEGLLHFSKEMISALLMAFVAIVYVIQAFTIPTGSMEKSLLIGDYLLGLKFVYGAPILPFSYIKFPGFGEPKPGDVVIFEYPGIDNKDYIKRCVAGPGQTISISGKDVFIDGHKLKSPPFGQYLKNGQLDYDSITHFSPLTIPAKGDTIVPANLPVREFFFAKNLINQEHPRNRFSKFLESIPLTKSIFVQDVSKEKTKMHFDMLINGVSKGDTTVLIPIRKEPVQYRWPSAEEWESTVKDRIESRIRKKFGNNPYIVITNPVPWKDSRGREFINVDVYYQGPFNQYPFEMIDIWFELDYRLNQVRKEYTDSAHSVTFKKWIELKGDVVDSYVVKNNNYFMMGDNRDNSADSRYWGYLNRKFVKAKAFILYFSLKKEVPLLLLPLKIRWNRIGKLILPWDGGVGDLK